MTTHLPGFYPGPLVSEVSWSSVICLFAFAKLLVRSLHQRAPENSPRLLKKIVHQQGPLSILTKQDTSAMEYFNALFDCTELIIFFPDYNRHPQY